jgi:monothiol glutaredoxin
MANSALLCRLEFQMDSSPETLKQIEEIVKGDKVVLFMKGNRHFPQCGFSATVVQILGDVLDDFKTVNVLTDPAIRQGIKDYANWPTIPQLYIDGEFVGGCDIVREMHASGELHKQLGVENKPPEPPKVTITDAAAAELRAALAESDPNDRIHVAIDPGFQHSLTVGPLEPGQIEVQTAGLPLVFDRGSARRAGGLKIDFLKEGSEQGFKIENPNRPG